MHPHRRLGAFTVFDEVGVVGGDLEIIDLDGLVEKLTDVADDNRRAAGGRGEDRAVDEVFGGNPAEVLDPERMVVGDANRFDVA